MAPPPGRQRFWLPVIVLAVFWIVVTWAHQGEVTALVRFLSRSIATLALLLFFTGWWFLRRSIRLRDRFLVAATVVVAFVAAVALSHSTVDPFVMLLAGVPWLCTLGLAWLFLNRGEASGRRAVGVAAVGVAIFGALTLLRWDGLDGRQQSSFSWRWSPTAEEQFLASLEDRSRRDTDARSLQRDVVLRPGDWPGFRGADREGVVPGVEVASWVTEPPEVVWRRKVGPAWSSVAVVDGLVFTQEQRGEEECTVCYDAASGDQVWLYAYPARFDEALSGPGPRGTPAFADGRIYSYGANGQLVCLAADTGEEVWSRGVLTEAGGKTPQWGLSVSPLVSDGLVVVFAGGDQGRGVLAFDAATGDPRWECAAGTESYASPHVLTLAGVRQIVMHDTSALRGIDIASGNQLWEHPNDATMFQPMLQPHLVGESDLVIANSEGIARLTVNRDGDAWNLTELWRSNRLKPSFNDFYVHKGHIYGLDDGIFCCVSLEDGRRNWKRGRYGFGQLLLLPDADQILVLTERGEVLLVAADPSEHREAAVTPVLAGKTWNHSAMAQGRLYVRNAEELVCLRCSQGAGG